MRKHYEKNTKQVTQSELTVEEVNVYSAGCNKPRTQ